MPDRAGCRNGSPASGPMPQETRNYVAAITGATVEEWADGRQERQDAATVRRPPAAAS